ncbi:sulfotransferase [Wenzhouxiangella sediminis]|uniref:Sulfotransferase n=2 Tax=Wenzhouxiangella sediminis TaxID=1792836 RepID=A0A3E1K5D0_9GAMM|nr:sulfotransferase [Wenzhouxiangella sediminis]
MKANKAVIRAKECWQWGRRQVRIQRMQVRRLVRPGGALPNFLIIGAMKSGTTTLFQMLTQHPGCWSPVAKELQFFEQPHKYSRGEVWYRAHFPTRRSLTAGRRTLGYSPVTGEATPGMSFFPYASRAAELVPQAKLIVSLRDPVERAWSHYKHMRRLPAPERATFSEAIDRELALLEQGASLTEENFRQMAPLLHKFGYVNRGHYADQLKHWFSFFPREQFLILNFEDWKKNPIQAADRITQHLGLPKHAYEARKANQGGHKSSMPIDCRERLETYFRPRNRELFKLLGEDWGWPY